MQVSQTLFGNPKGPVELGNPNTCAETKLCLILFYSGSRSISATSLRLLYNWFRLSFDWFAENFPPQTNRDHCL